MGCKSREGKKFVPIQTLFETTHTAQKSGEPPFVQDFHCGECGLTARKRPPGWQHVCNASETPDYQKRRQEICESCSGNVGGVCQPYKQLHPDRDCIIDIGIKLPFAGCPENKWHRTLIQCPECNREIFDEHGPKWCHYCDWNPQGLNRPSVPAPKRAKLGNQRLVVTGCNEAFLRGAYYLAWTLLRSNDVRMLVFLEDEPTGPHVEQMQSWGVQFASMPMDFDRDVDFYPTWNKPACIRQAMEQADQVLWLDADTAVAGSIQEAFDTIDKHPFSSDHGDFKQVVRNGREIWDLFGKPPQVFKGGKSPCAGVVGFDSARDVPVVNEWRRRCKVIVDRPELWQVPADRRPTAPLKYHDQGVLQDLWEWPAADGRRWSNFAGMWGTIETMLNHIYRQNNTTIWHYGGNKKPWFKWPDLLNWGDPKES